MRGRAVLLCLVAFILATFVWVGCGGSSSEPPSPFGTWRVSSMSLTSVAWSATDLSVTQNKDGTYIWSFTGADSNPYWWSGDMTPASLPPDTPITLTVLGNSRGNSTSGDQYGGPGVNGSIAIKYSKLSESSITFYVDAKQDGTWEGPFAGSR